MRTTLLLPLLLLAACGPAMPKAGDACPGESVVACDADGAASGKTLICREGAYQSWDFTCDGACSPGGREGTFTCAGEDDGAELVQEGAACETEGEEACRAPRDSASTCERQRDGTLKWAARVVCSSELHDSAARCRRASSSYVCCTADGSTCK